MTSLEQLLQSEIGAQTYFVAFPARVPDMGEVASIASNPPFP